MPYPQQPMRVLGTRLPASQTVHENMYGKKSAGRPVVIKPNSLKLSQDKSRPQNYRLLWQKTKPDVLTRAQGLMDTYGGTAMPPALKPKALSAYEARKHRREH